MYLVNLITFKLAGSLHDFLFKKIRILVQPILVARHNFIAATVVAKAMTKWHVNVYRQQLIRRGFYRADKILNIEAFFQLQRCWIRRIACIRSVIFAN